MSECKHCKQAITWVERDGRALGRVWVPLNVDGTHHRCRRRRYPADPARVARERAGWEALYGEGED